MLSALILTADAGMPTKASPEAIVRTLSALVPAAIEGLVKDVVLAGPAGAADLRNIADHAGCELAEAEAVGGILAAGLRQVRGEALFVLRAGRAPERGMLEEMGDVLDDLPRLRALRIRAVPETFVTRLVPSLAPTAGLLALRSALPKAAPHLEALVRAARPARSLRARLRRVG